MSCPLNLPSDASHASCREWSYPNEIVFAVVRFANRSAPSVTTWLWVCTVMSQNLNSWIFARTSQERQQSAHHFARFLSEIQRLHHWKCCNDAKCSTHDLITIQFLDVCQLEQLHASLPQQIYNNSISFSILHCFYHECNNIRLVGAPLWPCSFRYWLYERIRGITSKEERGCRDLSCQYNIVSQLPGRHRSLYWNQFITAAGQNFNNYSRNPFETEQFYQKKKIFAQKCKAFVRRLPSRRKKCLEDTLLMMPIVLCDLIGQYVQ